VRRIPGHGLGLSLIRHIAETHGGRASFVDKQAPGTRLEIRLPLAMRRGG
jgi:signal transduction histidine kinase